MNKKTVYSATAQMLKRMVIDVMFRCIFAGIVVGNFQGGLRMDNVSLWNKYLASNRTFQTYPFFINAQNEPYDVG